MSAFSSLVLLILIAVASMVAVAFSNYKVEQAKKLRARLQKYKARVEELEDVVLALDSLCERREIPKLINDDVIELYQTMIELDPKTTYLEAGLSNAKMRSNELSDESVERHITRLCQSDAQIARLQTYLKESINILRKQHNQGKVSASELQDFILEIEWLHLQVSVISSIAQGHKAYNRQDVLTANAFYKKAQSELMRSSHPDERRHKMIKQMADLLFGRRKSIDTELMPEDEYNPENIEQPSALAEGEPLDAALTNEQQEQLASLAGAMAQNGQTGAQQRSPAP